MKRDELFDKFLQRSLSRDEAEALKTLLRDDPATGRAFVEHINEAGLLVRVASQMQSVPRSGAEIVNLPDIATAAPSTATNGSPTVGRSLGAKRRRHLVALAACLIGLSFAAWFFVWKESPLRATVANVAGEASVVRGAKVVPAEVGTRLQAGDIVQTGPQSRASVVFDGEATRAELQGNAAARFTMAKGGKRVEVTEGALEANVAPQPAGRPMTLATLHAEARVVGTRLLVASEVSSTRLEVTEGAVEFMRRSDGQTLLVKNGFAAVASPNTEFSLRPFLPAPWASRDIGAVRLQGQARFDGSKFRLRGSGQDTCCKKDQFHFMYQPLPADGEILACVREIEFADPESRASLVLRRELKTASPQVAVGVTASGGLEIEHRTQSESRIERAGWAAAPSWLKLVRRGEVVTAYKSTDGVHWLSIGSQPMKLAGPAFVGLSVTSFNHAALSTAVFDHVAVSLPSQHASAR